jgi:hypothetical protein
MKSAFLVILIAAACCTGAAVPSQKQIRARAAQLGDSYVKAALPALQAIAVDDTVPHIDNGKPLGDKDTVAAIDAAAAKAQKPPEVSSTAALRAIYNDKLLDNDRRNTKKMDFESDSGLEDEGSREMTAMQRMQSDAEIIAMDQAERSCFDAMDAVLQSRSFNLPPACVSWSPSLRSLQKDK